MTEITGN